MDVSPEILEQYVGVYVIAGKPVKMTITRKGATISIQNGTNTIPLEAITTNKFKLAYGVTVEFDTTKKQAIIKRPQGEGVFTKEN